MKKVLEVITVPFDNNGIVTLLYNYLVVMDKDGLSVDVLTTREVDTNVDNKFASLGCCIYKTVIRNHNPIGYIHQLSKLIRKNKYNIVHVHGNSATMAFDLFGAMLGGCKNRIAHSHNTMCEHVYMDKILRPFFRVLYTERFACGEKAGGWLFKNQKFDIIPVGINVREFRFDKDKRKQIRNELGIPEDHLVIGHVGGFNKAKNQKFIVDVFNALCSLRKDVSLILVGSGDMFEEVKNKVSESDFRNNIHLPGRVNCVVDYLDAMDVMVMPSFYEGFPQVVMEWQANGLKCVVSTNVTRECAVTDNVQFLSLSDGISRWVKEILLLSNYDREMEQIKSSDLVSDEGYDIVDDALKLKMKYMSM